MMDEQRRAYLHKIMKQHPPGSAHGDDMVMRELRRGYEDGKAGIVPANSYLDESSNSAATRGLWYMEGWNLATGQSRKFITGMALRKAIKAGKTSRELKLECGWTETTP